MAPTGSAGTGPTNGRPWAPLGLTGWACTSGPAPTHTAHYCGTRGAGDFDAQAEQVFRNLERVLAAGGSSLADVVKVTIFLTDMANFPKIVDLRGRWFTEPYPADTIVEVSALALPELEIEIEAIAVAG